MKQTLLLIICLALVGCAAVQPKKAPTVQRKKLTVKEQQQASLKLFKKILQVAEQKGDSPDALQERIRLLKEMARKYPDAPLSQEAYWHIINIYLNRYYPPKVDEAEQTYKEFLKEYPDSPMKSAIESTFNLFYFQHKMWDKLEALHRQRIKHFIETGSIDSPFYFYM